MPKYAFVMLVFICLLGALALPMTASLLKIQRSWAESLTKVKASNEEQAPLIVAERRQLKELRSAVSQANLGWDQIWTNITAQPQPNGNVRAEIGSDNGVAEGMTLHAFQPVQAGGGYIYVGPFTVQGITPNTSMLEPGWVLLMSRPYNEAGSEFRTWVPGSWRFRTQIPAGQKVEFETSVKRFGTNIQTLTQLYRSYQKQDVLFKAAEAQLEQRQGELVGANDPDAKVDPLRPELTKGLVVAMESEEEARNLLQLDIDALRRAILDTQQEIKGVEAQVVNSSGVPGTPARIGSRK